MDVLRQLLLLAGMAALGVVALVLLEQLIRRPLFAAGVALGVTVLDATVSSADLAVRLGGVRVTLVDVAFVMIAAAGGARWLRLRRVPEPRFVLLVVCVLVALSLVRGFAVHGEPAFNEFRVYVAFFGSALYFSTVAFTSRLRDGVGRIYVVAAVALAAVVAVRWAALLAGVDLGPFHAQYDHAIRVLSGPETYFFAGALLLTLPGWVGYHGVRGQRFLSAVFLVLTILLNRRAVWVAVVAGFAVLAFRYRHWTRQMASAVATVVLVGIVAALVLPAERVEDEGVAQGATDTATLEWRIEGWRDLLEQGPETVGEWAIGEPYGEGFERVVDSRVLASNPHSTYVGLLLRIGIVGMAALLALYAVTARRLGRARGHEATLLSPEVLLAMLAAHVVWAFTWQPSLEQGLFLGLAVAAAAAQRPPAGAGRPRRRAALPAS